MLITRIYRKLKNLNLQRTDNPMNKWANELNRQLSKKQVQLVNKYMNICSTTFTSPQWSGEHQFQTTTNASEDAEKKGTLIHSWWECKLAQALGK
jgi:hypothetical protein